MTNEQRHHERVRLPLEARWEGLSGKHEARVYDISVGGCYIETLGQVTPGERVSFQIQLPGGIWLQLHGEIVHGELNIGFGLRFIELGERECELLLQMVELARNGKN